MRKQIQLLSEQRGVVQQTVYDALLASNDGDKPEAVARKAVTDLAVKLKQRPEWAGLPDAAILTAWLVPDLSSLPMRSFQPVEAPPAPAKAARGRAAEPAAELPPAPRKVAALDPEGPGKLTFTTSDALGTPATPFDVIINVASIASWVPSDISMW